MNRTEKILDDHTDHLTTWDSDLKASVMEAMEQYGKELLINKAHDVYNKFTLFDSNHNAITGVVRDFILQTEL